MRLGASRWDILVMLEEASETTLSWDFLRDSFAGFNLLKTAVGLPSVGGYPNVGAIWYFP